MHWETIHTLNVFPRLHFDITALILVAYRLKFPYFLFQKCVATVVHEPQGIFHHPLT